MNALQARVWKFTGEEDEEVGIDRRPIAIRADRQQDRRTRGMARGDLEPDPQAHQEADPEVVEEWKWMGTPVCTGESYKAKVKLTFAKGASLQDPSRLFNSSLDGNTRRAIDIEEGQGIDEGAFKALVRSAVALNAAVAKAKAKRTK
jgi:hypothetical protein